MTSPISPEHEGLQTMDFPSGLEVPIHQAPQAFLPHNPLYIVDVERGNSLHGSRRQNGPVPDDCHETQSAGKPTRSLCHNLYRASVAALFLIVAGAAMVWGVGGARLYASEKQHSSNRSCGPSQSCNSSPLAQVVSSFASTYTYEVPQPSPIVRASSNVTQTISLTIVVPSMASTSVSSPLAPCSHTLTSGPEADTRET
ncbi:hypothetical protein HYFRA_00006371 [Hymenoscyphus fraxineus]|uniref:Transmembrane protein n=1 Tax=Hymenoscyphus fraxineus TaxID=746836 RepID=A0A9N9PFX2_9HELO|nr:hypothetical protein HYFRA_00006371 [Hymenoscyphus fraxineus]